MTKGQRLGVPAAPNESRIRGTIIKIQQGPEGIGHVWKVVVIESHGVVKGSNFAQAIVGKTISILVHPDMKKKLSENDFIEARIFFQGDERGGAFFLIDNEVHKIS